MKQKKNLRPQAIKKRCQSYSITKIAFALLLVTFNSALADDSEVFFGQVDRSKNTQPNVLFILDTSGSMNENDHGFEKTRLERMKDAMSVILNQATGVNIGLMRLNGHESGGAVIYPITNIDEEVCVSNNCGEISFTSKISSAQDDIEERDDGSTQMNGSVLNIGDYRTENDQHLIGLRFTGVNIPQGAKITDASLTFTSQETRTGSSLVWIRAQQADNAEPFSNERGAASERSYGHTHAWYTDELPEPSPTPPGYVPVQGWEEGYLYSTDNLAELVQEVVDRDGWCGGNSMAFLLGGSGRRDAYAYEANSTDAPQLKITYDSQSLDEQSGCTEKRIVARVNSGRNDAEEKNYARTATGSPDLEIFNDGGKNQTIGLRFTEINLPANAEIVDARIEFEGDGPSWGNVSGRIFGERTDNPRSFSNWWRNIRNRPKTSVSVNWNNIPAVNRNETLTSPNIAPIVQNIIARSGWRSGNAMVFILENNGSNGLRDTKSYERSASAAPKLTITYLDRIAAPEEAQTYISAREMLLRTVSDMSARQRTPIVDTLYEATLYYTGKPVEYGRVRGKHYTQANSNYHRVSHPLSYTGGAVSRHEYCTDANLDSWYCRFETITGNARYKSPMLSECQTNHIVLLSDGDARSNASVGKVKSLTGVAECKGHRTHDEMCGLELVEWLHTTDLSTLRNTQTIRTYTIGFNLQSSYLKALANKGGGQYYEASSSAQLVDTFKSILGEAHSIDTSFVAPGATVNQFNRLTHRSDIYFALFKPQSRPNWSGNLKKYQIGLNKNNEVTVFDHSSPMKNAVDSESGYFAENATSDWSTVVDGKEVALGGAAEQHKFFQPSGSGSSLRQLYTYLGDVNSIPRSGINLRREGDLIHEMNPNILSSHVGASSPAAVVDSVVANRTNLLRWMRGVDVKNEDNDLDESGEPFINEMRLHMGDPMHSRPVLLNYSATSGETHTTVFLGTNEGVLHAIDNKDGRELFAYMPAPLMRNIAVNFENSSASPHLYGLDGPMTTWTEDANQNVMIDAGESAMLYVGMRRGGSNYYAFDVSQRENPRLMWIIRGGASGTPGFENLGQSWSRMAPSKLRINGSVHNVLIFGGGYDTSNDIDYTLGQQANTPDSIGNSIYIVDAETGQLLYSLGGRDTDASQKFSAMTHSIPSDVRVLDIDGNGFADSLFVGDMGGQVWRFDFNLYHEFGDGNLLQGGVLAELARPQNTLSENRRFFYEPDVALMRENGERYLSISIGSGWRSHPLNTKVRDRFYLLRSPDVYRMPEGYGKKTDSGFWVPLQESDLNDVSSDVNNGVRQHGWMLKFNRPGEKVLGDAITAEGQVVFTTYLPETTLSECSTAIGSGAVYALRVADGRPSLDLNDNGSKDIDDRSIILSHAGVPPEASALIVEGANGKIKPTILVGPEQPLRGLFNSNLTKRTFWLDAGMTEQGAQGVVSTLRDLKKANTQNSNSR